MAASIDGLGMFRASLACPGYRFCCICRIKIREELGENAWHFLPLGACAHCVLTEIQAGNRKGKNLPPHDCCIRKKSQISPSLHGHSRFLCVLPTQNKKWVSLFHIYCYTFLPVVKPQEKALSRFWLPLQGSH